MPGGGSKPGQGRGGRPKGSLNKNTLEVAERLAAIGCDPLVGMAKLASGVIVCVRCKGRKKIPGPPIPGETRRLSVICHQCNGTGREVVSTDIRGRMLSELAQYVAPKRRAIDHRGDALGIEALLAHLDGNQGRGT
jgi:hypothetical protein